MKIKRKRAASIAKIKRKRAASMAKRKRKRASSMAKRKRKRASSMAKERRREQQAWRTGLTGTYRTHLDKTKKMSIFKVQVDNLTYKKL